MFLVYAGVCFTWSARDRVFAQQTIVDNILVKKNQYLHCVCLFLPFPIHTTTCSLRLFLLCSSYSSCVSFPKNFNIVNICIACAISAISQSHHLQPVPPLPPARSTCRTAARRASRRPRPSTPTRSRPWCVRRLLISQNLIIFALREIFLSFPKHSQI